MAEVERGSSSRSDSVTPAQSAPRLVLRRLGRRMSVDATINLARQHTTTGLNRAVVMAIRSSVVSNSPAANPPGGHCPAEARA